MAASTASVSVTAYSAPGLPVVFFQVPEAGSIPAATDAASGATASASAGVGSTQIRFLLDSSGSMSSHWPHLAPVVNSLVEGREGSVELITFSTTAHEVPTKKISTSIHDHHCGGTNIWPAVEALVDNIGRTCKPSDNVTVVFVSDGDGEALHWLMGKVRTHPDLPQTVNFICWGVGSGFPTGLAMALREKFHRGPASTPPVYLVESFADFATQAPEIAARFEFTPTVIDPPVVVQPWTVSEPTTTVQSRSWVALPTEVVVAAGGVVSLNGTPIPLAVQPVTRDAAMAVFKQWTGAAQLASLRETPADVQRMATLALEWMVPVQAASEAADADALAAAGAGGPRRTTVLHRLEKAVKGAAITLATFVREAQRLRDGDVLSSLTDAERAQRLKIGTVTGKYHDKALALRGLDAADFATMKANFLKVLKEHPLAGKTTAQPGSVVTLETTMEVLQQPDLALAVRDCPSAFHWVEACPLVGYGCEITRSSGAMINPWLVNLRRLARVNAVVDSLSLIENGGSYKFATGADGEQETVNALLPLLSASGRADDAALAPYYRSRLFQLLVHFQVVGNADTFDPESYIALLAAAHWNLLQQPASEWRSERIRMVLDTVEAVYGGLPADAAAAAAAEAGGAAAAPVATEAAAAAAGGAGGNKVWQAYLRCVAAGDARTLTTDHPDNVVEGGIALKCPHFTKPLLALALCARAGVHPSDEYTHRLMAEALGRAAAARLGQLREADATATWVKLLAEFFALRADPAAAAEQAPADGADGAAIVVRDADGLVETARARLPASLNTACTSLTEVSRAVAAAAEGITVNPAAGAAPVFDGALVERNLGYWGFTVASLAAAVASIRGTPGVDLTPDADTLAALVFHACKENANSHARNSARIQRLGEAESEITAALLSVGAAAIKSAAMQRLQAEAEAAYLATFNAQHDLPLPLTPAKLVAECARLGIEGVTLENVGERYYFARSGLLRNACCSAECPHYLKPMTGGSLFQHLSSGWGHRPAPALHVAALQDRAETADTAVADVKAGRFLTDPDYASKVAPVLRERFATAAATEEKRGLIARLQAVYSGWSAEEIDAVARAAAAAPRRWGGSTKATGTADAAAASAPVAGAGAGAAGSA